MALLKVALLFLVYDDVFHAHYWEPYINDTRFTIYVHSKEGVPDASPFKPYELPHREDTNWLHTMKAQIYLLSEAYKNADNYKFVYVTDTTIPIRSRLDIYEILTRDPYSYFTY